MVGRLIWSSSGQRVATPSQKISRLSLKSSGTSQPRDGIGAIVLVVVLLLSAFGATGIHGKGNLGAKPRADFIAEILPSIKERRA